jgi:squalene-associated FAD-dependent desaturase
VNIAVVGGGISGLRAALTLARAGHAVSLVEKNRFLGGRAFSFQTPDLGEIDIGQHVWLRCCTALEHFIRDLRVPPAWVYRQDKFEIFYRRPGKSSFRMQSAPLPGLLHLLPDMLRFPGLKARDVWALFRGVARARSYSSQALERLDSISFEEWLRQHRQTPAAVAALWEPLVLAVCNQRPRDVSARHALFTYRQSLLKSRDAADICFFRRPLSAVLDRQARLTLEEARVEVLTGTLVRRVQPGDGVGVVLEQTGERRSRSFDRVVLALPLRRARALLAGAEHLPEPPPDTAIAGLLLKFARPVMSEMFFAALDSPIQWVFNKTAVWTDEQAAADGSQLLEVIISGAERERQLGGEAVRKELLPALSALLPDGARTPLLAWRFVQHAAATFAVAPGGEVRRVAPLVPGLWNVVFAGDGAATGWPSTMESAARAGQAAAEVIMSGAQSTAAVTSLNSR